MIEEPNSSQSINQSINRSLYLPIQVINRLSINQSIGSSQGKQANQASNQSIKQSMTESTRIDFNRRLSLTSIDATIHLPPEFGWRLSRRHSCTGRPAQARGHHSHRTGEYTRGGTRSRLSPRWSRRLPNHRPRPSYCHPGTVSAAGYLKMSWCHHLLLDSRTHPRTCRLRCPFRSSF